MVKFRNGPFKEGIDNKVFIIPAIIVVSLIVFIVYKLVSSLHKKELLKEERRKAKQIRKEKEQSKKFKKK